MNLEEKRASIKEKEENISYMKNKASLESKQQQISSLIEFTSKPSFNLFSIEQQQEVRQQLFALLMNKEN